MQNLTTQQSNKVADEEKIMNLIQNVPLSNSNYNPQNQPLTQMQIQQLAQSLSQTQDPQQAQFILNQILNQQQNQNNVQQQQYQSSNNSTTTTTQFEIQKQVKKQFGPTQQPTIYQQKNQQMSVMASSDNSEQAQVRIKIGELEKKLLLLQPELEMWKHKYNLKEKEYQDAKRLVQNNIDKEKNENKLLRQQVSERENEISTLYYYNQNLTAKLNEKIAQKNKEIQYKEIQQKETQQKETQQKETQQKETQQKETQQKYSMLMTQKLDDTKKVSYDDIQAYIQKMQMLQQENQMLRAQMPKK